jgi:ribosomal protein S18 acetylase RimI-like enzyme
MSHILDRPAWNALATVHADFAEGSPLARRYDASIILFGAAADDSPDSLSALAALPSPQEVMLLVEAGPVTVPPLLETTMESILVQMLSEQTFARIADPRIEQLSDIDAQEMLDLALLTKPGPFTLRAQALGTFWGIRIDGRIVAMCGQRMRQPGFSELSGLCVHPDFQGKGLGKLMLRFVAGEISARNEAVYLHAYKTNTGAIALYQSLGFGIRADMNLRVVKPAC